jgi:hypothetical protein
VVALQMCVLHLPRRTDFALLFAFCLFFLHFASCAAGSRCQTLAQWSLLERVFHSLLLIGLPTLCRSACFAIITTSFLFFLRLSMPHRVSLFATSLLLHCDRATLGASGIVCFTVGREELRMLCVLRWHSVCMFVVVCARVMFGVVFVTVCVCVRVCFVVVRCVTAWPSG